MKSGGLLVLLDGLDEVPSEARRIDLVDLVSAFARNLSGGSRVIISSRPHEYARSRFDAGAYEHFELCPFNDGEIQQFLRGWCLLHEPNRAAADEEAQRLWQAVEAEPRIKELADNALLLTMIVRVHWWLRALPDSRLDLYANVSTMIHRLLIFLVTICSAPAGFAASNEARQAALSSISADELQAHVDALADDMFEGRKAGSRGGRAAGTYLVTLFEKHGLQPAGDEGSFFQTLQSGYRNILAVMPGSDPELKDQYILIGAHYDHVGYGSRSTSYGPLGFIHNGADDNASGTAAVLELIEAFSMVPQLPRRSIVFALWDGEEQGLKGSKHWVANPTVSLSKICAVINCDMIGRLGEKGVKIYGTRSSQGLRKLISHNNRQYELPLNFTWEMKANSDHWPFFQQNIPVLMFHTGLHDQYRRPADVSCLVQVEGAVKVVSLVHSLVRELADRTERPAFRRCP